MGGILAGYASGFWFIDTVGGWRSMYGVAAPLALLLGVGMVRVAGGFCACVCVYLRGRGGCCLRETGGWRSMTGAAAPLALLLRIGMVHVAVVVKQGGQQCG